MNDIQIGILGGIFRDSGSSQNNIGHLRHFLGMPGHSRQLETPVGDHHQNDDLRKRKK